MRLTLRTLLAYYDRVLSPADQQDLHHRIQQNADAAELLRRIDVLIKQSQLVSPPLSFHRTQNELGEDPNSVAEYLDDALYGPKIPEFERICLESNVHLAELAHCHQLLATGLHTQVMVPTSLRDTALRIIDPQQRPEIESRLLTRTAKSHALRAGLQTRQATQADQTEASRQNAIADSVQVSAPMVASGGGSIRPAGLSLEGSKLSSEVPEYLMGSSRPKWRMPLAIAGTAILLCLLLWQTLGPWDKLRGMFASAPPPAQAADDNGGLVVELAAAPELTPTDADASAESPLEKLEASIEDASDLPGITAMDAQPVSVDSLGADREPAITESPSEASAATSQPSTSADAATEIADAGSSRPPLATWTPANPAASHLLMIQQPGALSLVQAGAGIPAEGEVICLPNTQEDISLPSEIVATVYGPSRLRIDATQRPAMVTSQLCRLLVMLPEESGLRVASPLGEVRIASKDGASRVSIEMGYRRVAHGSVVERDAYAPVQVMLAAEGSARIVLESDPSANEAATTFDLSIGEAVALIHDQRPLKFRLTNIPGWLRPGDVRPIDALAVEDLASRMTAENQDNLSPPLAALANDRRPETASLAIQASMLSGDWRPFVDGLFASDRLRSHWQSTLSLARQLLAAEPQSAADLREMLLEKHGLKQGAELFQLLLGLPEDQLTSDGLSSLLTQMDSDSLVNRVLAAFELESVIGQRLAYQPHAPNRASVQQWRRDVATKRMAIRSPEDPLIERSAP